eukprot:7377092-Prymnesium_polylepis.2
MAPRNCQTHEELEWRRFVIAVQQHNCRPKCHWKNGQFRGEDFCKTGYPRPIFDEYEVRQQPTSYTHAAYTPCTPAGASATLTQHLNSAQVNDDG